MADLAQSDSEHGYGSGADHLRDWFDWVLVAVQRHVARRGHRLTQAGGQLSDLYVSLAEVRAVLGGRAGPDLPRTLPQREGWPDGDALSAQLYEARARIARRVEQTYAVEVEVALPLDALQAAARLDEPDVALLVAAATPLLSIDIARLYTFAWADFAVKQPSVGFLAELVADTMDPALVGELVGRLGDDSRLCRMGLVTRSEAGAWSGCGALLHQAVAVPEAVLAFLRGTLPTLPAEVEVACSLDLAAAPRPAPKDLAIDEALRAELLTSLQRAARSPDGRPRVVLCGPRGSGRRSLIAGYLASLGRGLLTLDLELIARDPDRLDRLLRQAALHALLHDAGLLLRVDGLQADLERWERLAPKLAAFTNRHEGFLVFSATHASPALRDLLDDVRVLELGRPTATQQAELWRCALSATERPLPDGLPDALAHRFDLTPGLLHRVAEDVGARTTAGARSVRRLPLSLDDVRASLRLRLDHALATLAEPIQTPLTWDDVVLSEEVKRTLMEILAQARHRTRVYDGWGFRRKVAYGTGLSCLFAGPPGTGKTMMAAVLARSLEQDLYRVDISRVVSKWVGETEKNLSRIFDEAQNAQAILLFDEADSLFSQRTSVQSSNDRFANMEVNYLLQRMESYEGTTILTTNFAESLDDAFKRRLKFRVQFPLPDAEQRARLWQMMIPAQVRLAADVNFESLGRDLELSGGNIKNAVLRAAFSAADEGDVLCHRHLQLAGRAEARETGILVRDH